MTKHTNSCSTTGPITTKVKPKIQNQPKAIDHKTVSRHELANSTLEVLHENKARMLTGHGYPKDLEAVCQAIVDEGEPVPAKTYARKDALIKALAEYLVENQAIKSVRLQMGQPDAQEWSKIRNLTEIRGWATVEEAVEILRGHFA